jgi:hypothetical protein
MATTDKNKLSRALIYNIKELNKIDLNTAPVEAYTREKVLEITDSIVKFYTAYSTICNALVKFRTHMRKVGVEHMIVMASHTPMITQKHNDLSKTKLEKRIQMGDECPEEISKLHLVIPRILNFAKTGEVDDDKMHFVLIDFYLMTQCRNSEIDTIEINELGEVVGGILKKRGREYAYAFNSFIDVEVYRNYRDFYNSFDDITLKEINSQMTRYLKDNGITVHRLREIGSMLTLRLNAIRGNIKCLTAANNLLAETLRHKQIDSATAHYGLLLDKHIALKHKLDECNDETIEQIKKLVEEDLSRKEMATGVKLDETKAE